jgi:hypothetical protein
MVVFFYAITIFNSVTAINKLMAYKIRRISDKLNKVTATHSEFIDASSERVTQSRWDIKQDSLFINNKYFTYREESTSAKVYHFAKDRESVWRCDGIKEIVHSTKNMSEYFYIIQETKYNQSSTTLSLTKQLMQACLYSIVRANHNVGVFVLNSEKGYSYVIKEEIISFYNELSELLATALNSKEQKWFSASTFYSNVEGANSLAYKYKDNIKFHYTGLAYKDIALNSVYSHIIKECDIHERNYYSRIT